MRVLIHKQDLNLYSKFMDLPGPKEHNILVRCEQFYEWATAKGYKTHKHLLKKVVKNMKITDYLEGESNWNLKTMHGFWLG